VSFKEDMEQLKRQMKQLEIEYEQWFTGVIPRPPWESRNAVEAIIRKYNRNPPRSVADNSVFQMHQAKFNTYSEMWNRRTRLKEEGKLPTGEELPGGRRAAPPPSAPAEEKRDKFRDVFESYVAARQKAGQSTGGLSFASFRRQLEKQSDLLRNQRGFKDVDFGVSTKNGKVSLVARPKK
jgi:hypothetical protein